MHNIACCGNDKSLKSGKFVKTNLKIKVQEQWPHINVLRKYTKRTTFDNLDLEPFVAGETRIIAGMNDYRLAHGRLKFLSQLMHWLCKCKDWGQVKGMYEAVMESIELGGRKHGYQILLTMSPS